MEPIRASRRNLRGRSAIPSPIRSPRSAPRTRRRSRVLHAASHVRCPHRAADAAIASLQKHRASPLRVNDSEGHSLLRLGPVASCSQGNTSKPGWRASIPMPSFCPENRWSGIRQFAPRCRPARCASQSRRNLPDCRTDCERGWISCGSRRLQRFLRPGCSRSPCSALT